MSKAITATVAFRLSAEPPHDESTVLVLRSPDGRDVIRVQVRSAGADPAQREWDDVRQNYLRWAGPDGTAPVLEATVAIARAPSMRSTVPDIVRVGLPLALIGGGAHHVRLRIGRARVDLIVDGRLVDENWSCGGLLALPVACDGVQVWPRELGDAELGLQPEAGVVTGTIAGSAIQYWTPPGHNRWVGDTMMFQDGQRLHLLYLIDRRHHGSKGGAGAHQIAHLSTVDLRHWDVRPLAVTIDEPWETVGTGGMVRHGGRWYLLYGLHTDRTLERTAVDDGQRTPLPCAFDHLSGPPMGTVASVSDDGLHFHKMRELVHPAQNPSVFAHPDGGFAMYAGYGAEGLFRSDDLRIWRSVDPHIIPHSDRGQIAPQRNSTECVCHLAWNGWHYLFGGRTGFWMARTFAGPYWDRDGTGNPVVAQPRWDIYDGLWVPMAAALADGRRILSGWLEDRGGWAGCLVLRELLQEDDGTLALRWPSEVVPLTMPPAEPPVWPVGVWPCRLTAGDHAVWTAADNLPEEYLFEVAIDPAPGAGAYALVFGGTGDLVDGCELRLDPRRRQAQWNTPAGGKPAAEVPDPAAIFATPDGQKSVSQQHSPHLPFHGGDFAITNVDGLDRHLIVRVLVILDRKSGSTIIDAEIGGRRTMITRRRALMGRHLHLVATAGAVAFSRPVIRIPVRQA